MAKKSQRWIHNFYFGIITRHSLILKQPIFDDTQNDYRESLTVNFSLNLLEWIIEWLWTFHHDHKHSILLIRLEWLFHYRFIRCSQNAILLIWSISNITIVSIVIFNCCDWSERIWTSATDFWQHLISFFSRVVFTISNLPLWLFLWRCM